MQNVHSTFRRLAAVAAAAGLVVSAHAQQPRVFKAEVDVVPLDLVVVDQEGRPVPGLQAGDFQVTIDGQARKVLTSQFLSSAASPTPAAAEVPGKAGWQADAAFESVYVGNQTASSIEDTPSRTVLIAIDQSGFSIETGRNAAMAARGLLDLLHPNDRVGLAVFPPPGPNVRPTRDRARVREALGQVTGASEPFPRTDIVLTVADAIAWQSGDQFSRDVVVQRSCSVTAAATCQQELDRAAAEITAYAQRQAQISLQGLGEVVRRAARDGSASAIVVVGTGLYAGGRATQLGLDEQVRDFARLAATSRATLYALYVESGFLDRDSMERSRMGGFSSADGDMRLEGLRQLASLSGGTVTRVAAGSDDGFRRVSLELSAYYLLGLESAPGDRDGRRHRIRVRVNRPNVTVRTREDLYLPAVRKLTGDEALRDALKSPELQRELPIRLATQMMREPGTDKIRLVVSALIGRDPKVGAPVRVGYAIYGGGREGTSAASDLQNRALPAVGTGADASLSYVETVQLTAGRYLLRLAALDQEDRLGSVEQLIDATLVGGDSLALSDLLLVDPLRAPQGTFTPLADGRITGDEVEAFVEVYPPPGQRVGSVAFDISDSPGSAAIASGTVVPEKRDDGRLVGGVNLEVRMLPPGVYMLNARVLDGDRLLGRVSRPFLLERMLTPGEPRAGFAFAATGGVVRAFARGDALRPDALDFFLNRLQAADAAPAGSAAATAAEAVRGSRFDAALAVLPEKSDSLSVAFLKGLALLGQGQLEPAATQFRAALRLSNDFLPAAFYLGACYAAGGRDREAAGAWQTSLVTEADSRLIYEVLADALLRLEDGKQAEAIVMEAQERWPGDDVFAPRLAAAKAILEQPAQAIAVLAPYIDRHPADAEPLFLAIRLLYEGHDRGKPLRGAAEDRALMEKYGALYREAGGANQALVARWVLAMTK